MRRAQARRWRHQAEINRESAESERGLTALLPDPATLIEHSVALHKRALLAIGDFAAIEDQIARLHEDLAARHPERRQEYRDTAEHARASSRRAREIVRRFTD